MVRETRRLWVGNLPETVCEEKIRDHFKRYGRVQSVKILLSSAFHPNLLLPKSPKSHYGHIKDQQINDNIDVSNLLPSSGGVIPSVNCVSSVGSNSSSNSSTTSNNNNNNNNSSNNNTISSNLISTNSTNSVVTCTTTNSANYMAGSVCATVAFIDIKSASKAHTAEHKFDDRVLITEYYEPSSIPSTSGENSPSSNCSSGTQSSQHLPSSQQQLIKNSIQPSLSTSITDESISLPVQQYASVVTPQTAVAAIVPPSQLSTVTVPTRFPTPNHGSSEDLSPVFGDRPTFYDRVARVSETTDQYARRPNNYLPTGGDTRGRTRDRYRNGSYSATIERSNPITLHRISSSSWHENSNPSPTARSVYGNMASAVVTPDGSYDPTSERRTSETDVSVKSSSMKKKKSRSGSESPCGGSTSSRSHSRSPSSCSSTNSASSNSNETSSPGGDPSRSRHLQSAVSTPATNSSNSNPAVHSEDNRPLAICVRNLPSRSSDTSLKDGLFHEYKKHGKVTWVKVVGQSSERYALVCFKKADDVDKALEVSHDKLFFGCKIEVEPYQGFDVEDNEFRPYEAELDEYHPKSTRTLFIGNLEKDITASELRKHFDCFGEIIEIDIKKQGVNAYAFCQYSDIISVVKAMRKMDGEHLGSNRIKLGFGKSMPTNCVWIDGISDNVSENYLTTQFNRFGLVSQVATDRERKLALVFFEQIQYAQTAVKEMRGVTLRGRKLQVDFASRECQDAFYDKLEKQSGGAGTIERVNVVAFEAGRDVSSTRGFEAATVVVPGARFNRYENTTTRSRASSFSRHSTSGATSPSSVVGGSTTPRGGRRGRYAEYHEGDTIERRLKSYDEYSQGSGASHEDDSYNYVRDRPDSPLSRLGAVGVITGDLDAVPVRRRSEKSPVSQCGGEEEYFSGTNALNSTKHHRVQSVVVSTTESQSAGLFPPPGDIRHLQKERYHLLEQLEECPSSGDELVSPYKRMKFDPSIDSISSVQTNLISDSNCDLILNHANESNLLLMHHRKSVEVRRLSDSNSLKHITVNNSRRPSTDSIISRHNRDPHDHVINVYTPHAVCKRRKTGNSMSESEHHSSRGRGHQLHSHHSHEASGGESADGSRPGTPLCDERPEILPSEPRRLPRDRLPNSEPLYLPLPKFAIQMYHQNRLFTSHSSLSSSGISSHPTTVASLANHTSLNSLSSPPPALLTRPTTHNNISLQSTQFLQQQQNQQHSSSHSQHNTHHFHHYNQNHSQSSIEQPPASPSRALSLSSYSSDSDMAPSSSPSIEERIKTLDEMFEKWSGGNTNRTHTFSDTSVGSNFASGGRHKFFELDVNEVQPSDILKSVLAKKSIFDDDLKRLENIGDKYEPREFANLPRTSLMGSFQGVTVGGIPTVPTTVIQPQIPTSSNVSSLITKPQPLVFQTPPINQIHQRINSVSPMNSPQPMSPYHSPSPTPTLVSASQKLNCVQSVAAAAKGLQYPFPSHPPIATPPIPTATPPAIPPTPPPPATECTIPSSIPITVIPAVTTTTTTIESVSTIVTQQQQSSVTLTRSATGSTSSCVPSTVPATVPSAIVTTPSSTPIKSKNSISKSISLQEKWSTPSQSTNNRNLNKSTSVPGSTNVGTVKSLSINKDDENPLFTPLSSIISATITTPTSTNSKKEAKLQKGSKSGGKQNSSKTDGERKRRNDSLDRRKNHENVDHKEPAPIDEQQPDAVETISNETPSNADEREKICSESKEREREHGEKDDELKLKQQEDDRREQDRLENELKENEERIRREVEEKERKEREREEVERRKQREEADRREQEENERLENEKRVLEEKLRQAEKDEEQNRLKREEILKLEDVSDVEIESSHELNDYSASKSNSLEHSSTKIMKDHHNKENAQLSRENTPFFETSKRRERVNSGSSPVRLNSKRRLSEHESDDGDDSKRFKNNSSISGDNRKILDRRDFKDPNRSSDKSKHHRHHSKSGSLKSGEDSRFDDRNRFDDQRRKDHDHDRRRSKDRSEKHRSRKNKEEKDISNHVTDSMDNMDTRCSPDNKCYADQDIRSSDDEHKKKDKKKSDGIGGLLDDSNYRQYGSGDNKSRDDKKYNRHNSGDRRGRNDDGNGSHTTSSSKSSSERRSRLRKQNANSSDDSDSDEPKKHSIFDIPDDGPAYISMYDKVKARSCKNMQKQEEEKKIKAKFSQLKQCRERKREEKKRSNSWDDDSESDIDVDRRNMKSKSKGFINSSSDEDDRRSRSHKDHFISDTESEPRRSNSNYLRNRLNELCDGESSESSLRNNKPRRKVISRKNSRSTRIASDTSDDGGGIGDDDAKPIIDKIKLEPVESHEEMEPHTVLVKEEICPIKVEEKPRIDTEIKPEIIKMEIKSETKEEPLSASFDFSPNFLPNKPNDPNESMFDIFSTEARKKHKKNKKRQKSCPSSGPDAPNPEYTSTESIKQEKPMSMETMFDELKREPTSQVVFHEKRRHSSRKEKKRDKSKEEHERSKEERYRLKKLKKQAKLSSDSSSIFDSQETNVVNLPSATIKRGEKMEDIFGPISDDDSHISPLESVKPNDTSNTPNTNYTPTAPSTGKDNFQPISLTSQITDVTNEVKVSTNEKDSHRERKKDKKRKDRVKTQPFDENSVDLDAAGRALEAQLMADSDTKPEEIPQVTTTGSDQKVSGEHSTDVFRFSDGDDVEIVVPEKKSEHSESHRTKEKKKKKKRSKDEKHQRHHHHSSSHSNSLMSPPSTPILTIDITGPDTIKEESIPLSKQSPSLPCLLDDTPPFVPLKLAISPRDQKLISPIPKTPTAPASTSKLLLETRKEPKNLIPGFGLDCDEKIHDCAVQSISSEYSSPKAIVSPEVTEAPKPDVDELEVPKTDDKTDEKSRVIISQEETEDAVAALLGESFGSSADYGVIYETDSIVEEEPQAPVTSESVIPEEEAEEMRKAVQSLNNEELDIKPDTPQSDNDLQIDTDTEDQDNEAANAWGMDRPKTPDVDLSQIQKGEVVKAIVSTDIPAIKPISTPTTVSALKTVITKTVQSESNMPLLKSLPTTSNANANETLDKNSVAVTTKLADASPKSIIIENRVLVPPVSSSVVIQQTQSQLQKQSSVRPRNIITTTRPQLIFAGQPRMAISIAAPGSPRQQAPPRQPVSTYSAIQQPTTITIPEKQYYQPPMVMVSPRPTEPRSQSPRLAQPQTFAQSVKTSISSPTIIRQQSPRPTVPNATHVVVQRQILSPTSNQAKPSQPTVVMSSSSNLANNIVLNRLPVTPVLAPISSKPQQSTSIMLPQPNVAQPSHNLPSAKPVSISISSPNFNKSVVTQASSDVQQHQNHTIVTYSTVRMGQIMPLTTQSTITGYTPHKDSTVQVGGKVITQTQQQHVQQNVAMASGQSKQIVHENKGQKSVIEQRVQYKGPPNVIAVSSTQQQRNIAQQSQQQPQQQQQQYKNSQIHGQIISGNSGNMSSGNKPQIQLQGNISNAQPQKSNWQQSPQTTLQKRTVPMNMPSQQVFVQQQSPMSKQVATSYVSQQTSQSQQSQQQLPYNQSVTVIPRTQVRPQIQIVNKPKSVGIVVQNQPLNQMQSHQQRPNFKQQQSQQHQPIIYHHQPQQNVQQSTPSMQQSIQVTSSKRSQQSEGSNTPPIPTIPNSSVVRREVSSLPSTVVKEVFEATQQLQLADQESQSVVADPVIIESKVASPETITPVCTKPAELPPVHTEPKPVESVETSSVIKIITSEPTEALVVKNVPTASTSTASVTTTLTETAVVEKSLLTEENVTKLSHPNVEYQIEQDSKEDSDYWSAKEVNIDSVIKKVDAQCTSNREKISSSEPMEIDKQVEEVVANQKQEDNSPEGGEKTDKEEEDFDEGVGNLDSKGVITGEKKAVKKGRSSRGGRKSIGEHIKAANTVSEEREPSPPVQPQLTGVQTRRGGSKAHAKRSRGGRVSSTKATASTRQTQISDRGSKVRNQNSESDIYEFHEDSGEEAAIVSDASETTVTKPVDGNRPRLILTINKGQSAVQAVTQASTTVASTTIASTTVQPTVTPVQSQPAVVPVVVTINSAPINSASTIDPPPQQISSPASQQSSSVQQQESNVNKDDFTAPQTAASLRKSRRLLERDGSRSTVDDIIEDVVKNLPPEQKPLQSNLSPSGMTPPRRSTRNTSQAGGKQIAPEKSVGIGDVRKSPRANRRTKDRKDSYTSADSSDEKSKVEDKKLEQETVELVKESKVDIAKELVGQSDVSESDVIKEDPPKDAESAKLSKDNQLEVKVEPLPKLEVPVLAEVAIKNALAITDKPTEKLTILEAVKVEPKIVDKSKVPQKPESEVVLDHVTGILTVVQQAKGQIAPVLSGDKDTHLATHKACSTTTKDVPQPKNIVELVTAAPLKTSSPISVPPPSPVSMTISAIKTAQITVPSQMEISKPVPTIVTATPVQSAVIPLATTTAPKQQQIRTHPLKAHVLNATVQMNKTAHQTNPSVLKSGSGGVINQIQNAPNSHQVIMSNAIVGPSNQLQSLQQQMSVHTTNLQRTGSPIVNQHTHNLHVNVQSRGTPSPISTAHSPRIQNMPQQKIVHQQPILQTIHVQQKLVHPSTIISQTSNIQHQHQQHQSHQQQIIHSNKIQSNLQALPLSGYPNVVATGAKHIPQQSSIQHVVKHHPGSIQIQHSNIHSQQQKHQSVVTQQHPSVTKQTSVQPSNQLALIHQQPNKIHQQAIQQAGVSQHIMLCASTNVGQPQLQQQQSASITKSGVHHQIPPGKSVIGLHQAPQIMTGAVASPPLKQSHLNSQQPIVTGASSSRVSVPPISPQGQSRTHVLQPGLPVPAFEASLHGEISGFGSGRIQSPPPAHQQASPITPGDGTFSTVPIRGVPREHYFMYQDRYIRTQDVLGHGARIPYIRRSPILPGSAEHKEISDIEEPLGTSPPLELRRPTSAPRATISIPLSLQSPQDRDSPQAAQVYGTRIPHPAHFSADVGTRFYENTRIITGTEPPPAHRSHSVVTPSPGSSYTASPSAPSIGLVLPHAHEKSLEQRERDKERSSIPGPGSMPSHGSLVPAMAAPTGRLLQVATPPHASQVPPQADSLLMLLQRYPVMWQGLLALKTDQAAVQMHFVFGNPNVASGSLPCNSDGSTPPLRIAQRMRLEQTQLEGVARKMQTVNEHCMLLALPCGRDHMDVLQQSTNLQTGFITYLQQKQAAGIVNIPAPGSEQAAYVVHIFPSCDFANENLARIAPDLLHRVADIAHLLIVIATV